MKINVFVALVFTILLGISPAVVKAGEPAPLVKQDKYWKAIKLFDSEEYSQALLYFRDILEKDSANCELNYYVGMCYHKLEKAHLAAMYFKVAAQESIYLLKIRVLAQYNRENYDYGI